MGNLGGGLRAIEWSKFKLQPFEKNFYVEDKRVSNRSDREVDEFRKSKEIRVRALILTHNVAYSIDRSKAMEFRDQSHRSTKSVSRNI